MVSTSLPQSAGCFQCPSFTLVCTLSQKYDILIDSPVVLMSNKNVCNIKNLDIYKLLRTGLYVTVTFKLLFSFHIPPYMHIHT